MSEPWSVLNLKRVPRRLCRKCCTNATTANSSLRVTQYFLSALERTRLAYAITLFPLLYLGQYSANSGVACICVQKKRLGEVWEGQEVQKFLGLAGYYRRFVRHFSSIAKPLYRLTERGREFKWTSECESAFAELKARLTTPGAWPLRYFLGLGWIRGYTIPGYDVTQELHLLPA